MTLPETLAAFNATMNATAGTCLVAGFVAIRSGRRELHRRLMLAAVGASALFLASYLARIALAGSRTFPLGGTLRTVYLAILVSHTVLAALLLPLVLRTLFLSLKGRFPQHRRIARLALPVWVYVSITGVAVYVLLYHVAA